MGICNYLSLFFSQILVDIDREAEQVLVDMTGAHQRTAEAAAEAQAAFDRANEAKNRSMGEVRRTI